MHRFTVISVFLFALIATAATAQPTLDSLWPNADGLRFAFQYHRTDLVEAVDYGGPAYLVLEGLHTTPGGEAQVLLGEHWDFPAKTDPTAPALPSLLSAIWRARPDLRDAISSRFAGAKEVDNWRPLLLHTGYFMKSATNIQMWQNLWDHSTWTYLDGEPSLGASFTHQLIPELADDIYLHGTVSNLAAVVTTGNGTYTDAVKVDYLIDLGIATGTDENGILIATVHGEISGHVFYVPDVGPVEMLEE